MAPEFGVEIKGRSRSCRDRGSRTLLYERCLLRISLVGQPNHGAFMCAEFGESMSWRQKHLCGEIDV